MINQELIVNQVTAMIYEKEPSLLERFGEKGKEKCREDNHHHMKQLHAAYELDQADFFIDYALWLDAILRKHGMTTQHLIDNFSIIKTILHEAQFAKQEVTESYITYLDQAMEALTNQDLKGEADH